ncbi:MAG: glycosyltransferase [Actinomycetota bacterium]
MEDRIAVLHVSQPTEAGVPTVVETLVRDQLARGMTVVVASPRVGWLADAAVDAGATHISWEADRYPGPPTVGETRALASIFKDVDPQLVHLHSSKAGLCGRLGLRGRLPTVFQPHGWSFWAVGGTTAAMARRWERRGARWTDALICVGDIERAEGIAAGISAPWIVVPNGVDLMRWKPATATDASNARLGLGIGTEPVAICVGRFTRQKGQDVLIDAWPRVRAIVTDARLYLVGDGPDRQSLEQNLPDGVEMVGERKDVSTWLAASDVVVLPSRWEGMSLVLLEAMASARPVVATDVAGMREVLGRGGGEVVPVEDREALARAIADRLSNRQILAAEGARGRQTIEKHHDVKATTDRIAQVYRDVLDRRTGAH